MNPLFERLRRMRLCTLAAAWLLWLWCLSPGTAHAQLDTASADALLRKSGLWEQLASIAPQVEGGLRASLAQAPQAPSEAETQRLVRALTQAHAPERLRARALETFMRGGAPQHVPALTAWFATPLGRQITQLEEAASASTQEPEATMRRGAALLDQISAERRGLVEALVETTRSAEGLAQMAIATTLAMQRGLASAQPSVPAPSQAELRAMLETQRPQMLRAYSALMQAGMAVAYESLPDADLARYLEMLKSPAGRHLNDLGLQAFSEALEAAAADFGRSLPALKDAANT